jgi:hypothetical protein
MRTLAEIGKTEAPDSEARVQMREQKIAQELGKTPGKDFPDVFESGPYGVRLAPAETQPRSTSPDNSAPSVAPMKYGAGTPFSDNPNPWDDIFGNRISSLGGFAPRNPNFRLYRLKPKGRLPLSAASRRDFCSRPSFRRERRLMAVLTGVRYWMICYGMACDRGRFHQMPTQRNRFCQIADFLGLQRRVGFFPNHEPWPCSADAGGARGLARTAFPQ